ncbi:methyl-accepting chemotaxis protein [Treponema zuelzerae]|mgnify:CR=1 FL=1|uniref:Methyl-accepting chemotaxis protein n=1 Tax=Teretinema zuelzerae TaxID=156 RepID=A0AAE3EK48_9SPIR|nr:methyl-accepting chemotaxis protein [Teretinema zuelzerae]MBN2812394.1 methyl-accepting chemotaxis protein [Spirochaetales bacterium]MCD1655800.1 methyl-accepting chemotaxis protein [Teretinema zuelzerae]
MERHETEQNYEDAIDKFVVGYNKSIILNSVTLHSLDILDQAMDQVESGLNTIVSAFEEMRATSRSTSDNTNRIDSMMGEILAKNGTMNNGIAERMKEIENAAANARSIATLFEELKQRTQSVAGITGSIQDVSDRTGILAINASIEAARAGTVGRGFRIIANEVRTLATQTGDFAKQIESNIGEFQGTVETLNKQMSSFVDLFSRFKTSFADILTSFSDNARTIDAAGQSLSEITGAIREEAQALNDGLVSLENVNDSMRDTHAILGVIQSSHHFLDTLLEQSSDSMGL